MSFVYYCPFCDQKIQCENEDDGAEAPCPSCHRTIRVRRSVTQNERNLFPGFSNAAQPPVIASLKKKEIEESAQKSGEPEPAPKSSSFYTVPTYKKPLLAIVFNVVACFNCVIALLLLSVLIMVWVNEGNLIQSVSVGAAFGGALIMALISWGIAQLVCYIGRISDNSDAIRRVLELHYSQKK